MSYSQQDEEAHILKHFTGRIGSLTDIGAYDGKTFSNTPALIERGWSGVLVEPEPMSFMACMQNTKEHAERLTYVNAALSVQGGLAQFWDSSGDTVSSLDPAHVDKWRPIVKAGMHPFFVNALTPEELFTNFPPGEFINLDVEGINWPLFQRIPFGNANVRMICVEYDDKAEPMKALAAKHGFRLLHKTVQNLIFVR